MPIRLSAFPKCYLDAIAGDRSMSVFDWITMARPLDADGLEMYEGFFTSLEPGYLDSVGEAISSAGFSMPMSAVRRTSRIRILPPDAAPLTTTPP